MNSHTKNVETLVVGATGLGLAYCLNNPDNALLVESSAMIGWEFSETMNPGTNLAETNPSSDLASSIKSGLIDREILSGDKIHLPAIAPVLYKRLYDSDVSYLFNTVISKVEKTSDGYTATLHNASGEETIKANRILDTTINGESFVGTLPNITSSKIYITLNKRISATEDVAVGKTEQSYQVIEGKFDTEAYLSLNLNLVNSQDRWPQARKKIHEFWLNKPADLKNWDIAAVATRLHETPTPILSDGDHIHQPAILEDNIITSIDAAQHVFSNTEALS